MRQLDRRALDAEMFEEYEEKFQWPLAIGIMLLLGEIVIADRRKTSKHRSIGIYPPAEEVADENEETLESE